jgi:hypothetical protein
MILNNYPKTAQLLQDYYTTMMLASIDRANIPDDFKETIRKDGISLDKIEIIVNSNPRHLFEFFDDRSMYIDIKANFDGTFQYALLDGNVSNLGSLDKFKTRKQADAAAIEAAISTLENKLNLLDNDNKDS